MAHQPLIPAASVPDAVVVVDEDGRIILVNDQAERLFGYGHEELVGASVEMLLPERVRDVHARHRGSFFSAPGARPMGSGLDLEARRKDGSSFPVEIGLAPLPDENGHRVAAIVRDVSDQLLAQETLRARARQQQVVAELGARAISEFDLDALMGDAVARVAETLEVGYSKILEVLPSGDDLLLRAGVGWAEGLVGHALVPGGRDSQAGFTLLAHEPVMTEDIRSEPRFTGPDLLRDHDIISGLSVAIGGDERPFGVLGAHATVRRTFSTDDAHFLQAIANVIATAVRRRRVEQTLEASEERFRSLFENVTDFLCTINGDGTFASVNRAAEQITGYTRQELVGMGFAALIASEDAEDTARSFARALAAKTARGTATIIAKGGERVTLEYVANLLREPGAPLLVAAIGRDVTEREQLEAQLRQAQKMEAVGQLAGGIAHDFNNILQIIRGSSYMLLKEIDDGDPVRLRVEDIDGAAARAAALVRQLLAFSRRQMLDPHVLDLNAAVAKMEALLGRILGEHIELLAALDPQLGRTKADPSQIEQVIVNLAVNARDAMPSGGKLTIETANVELDEGYARSHAGVVPGPYVMLAVSDNGVGMDRETLTHVFEPFFTTKTEGSGLGLSTVFGIIAQTGGHVWVYSEPGAGTTFKIYLPQVDTMLTAEDDGDLGVEAPRGTETILLVEDEDDVRGLVREILVGGGYTVFDVRLPGEALSFCAEHEGPIDVLVTDVVMPEMGGRELAERVVVSRPEIKVLFISGYADRAIYHNGVLGQGTAFLQKPFTVLELKRRLRELLDGPQ